MGKVLTPPRLITYWRPSAQRCKNFSRNHGVPMRTKTPCYTFTGLEICEFGAERPMEKSGEGRQEGMAWLPKTKIAAFKNTARTERADCF